MIIFLFIFIAVMAILHGAYWSAKRRARAECAEHGHSWRPLPFEDGLECVRCCEIHTLPRRY